MNMDDLDFRNKCEKCKFYCKHYKIVGNKLRSTYGSCAHENASSKRRNDPFAFKNNCADWQEAEQNDKQTYQSVKEVVKQINDRLAELLLILTADDEE